MGYGIYPMGDKCSSLLACTSLPFDQDLLLDSLGYFCPVSKQYSIDPDQMVWMYCQVWSYSCRPCERGMHGVKG
jgi:hypothetical protein